MLFTILKIGVFLLLFASCIFFGFSIGKYLKDYKVFPLLYAKILGQVTEVDRIRRMQMRETFQKNSDILAKESEQKEPTIIEKFYRKISMTGISSLLPGFSEASSLIVMCFTGLLCFVLVSFLRNITVGIAVTVAYFCILLYLLNILAYKRKIQVEVQLLDFVNTVATASRQYSNLIDIFGATYESFNGALSKALEECYVEAHVLNNNDIAIQHLKDKFDSIQFAFILDNLLLCSKETGDYFSVSTDLSKTVSIYIYSHEKKQAILKNAKITLTIMAILTVGIIYILGMFLGGVDLLIVTTGGTIVLIAMILLYFYGLNMKVD